MQKNRLNIGKQNKKDNVIQLNTHIHNSAWQSSNISWWNITWDIINQEDIQNTLSLKADLIWWKVPASQLPSYVDDVLEFSELASLPTTGEAGKIYITIDNNKIYRRSGSTYVEVSQWTSWGVIWWDVAGTLANQTDLQTALDWKANTTHTHTMSQITDAGDLSIKDTISTADVDNNVITNTKLAQVSGGIIKGRLYGTGDVQDVAMGDLPISTATQTALNDKLSTTLKWAINWLAELDWNGKVPSSQLPSFVDDVVEVVDFASLPVTWESGKIYIATDTNITYRRSWTSYVEISSSLALWETSSTAYRWDRGKIAYDHSQLTSWNPHNVTKTDVWLSNVDNTSDLNKPISTATQTALNWKASTTHTHNISDTTWLQTALDWKISNITWYVNAWTNITRTGSGTISDPYVFSSTSSSVGDVSCSLTKTTAQTLTSNVWWAVTWDSENYDTHWFHDNTTNNTRITIPSWQWGKYLINISLYYLAQFAWYGIWVRKNGATEPIIVTYNYHNTNARSYCGNLSQVIQLNAWDYIEIWSIVWWTHVIYDKENNLKQTMVSLQKLA